jgi:glycosyltransferase involved in cell wall biosynthesis
MTRNDLAIYLPSTAGLYDRARARSAGAERQMVLLAEALSGRGYRVAQVVWPIVDRIPLGNERLVLVERAGRRTKKGPLGALLEAFEIWRALSEADARAVVVRKRQGALLFATLYCRLRRRRLIFSSANNSEFLIDQLKAGQPGPRLYKWCLRSADAVVVQSEEQVQLARALVPQIRRVVRIPSFAELSLDGRNEPEPSFFVWIGRAVENKQPLLYLDLARALPEAEFLMIPVPDISYPDSPLLPVLRAAPNELPNLRVIDPLPHVKVVELIRKAVAVVNTTSRFEGMPNTFLEGWAAGVPALTLEFDPDGVVARHGLGVSADGSWERFVAGARDLWETRRNRDQLSQRVRSYVRETHSVVAVGNEWAALIAEIARVPPSSIAQLPVSPKSSTQDS